MTLPQNKKIEIGSIDSGDEGDSVKVKIRHVDGWGRHNQYAISLVIV